MRSDSDDRLSQGLARLGRVGVFVASLSQYSVTEVLALARNIEGAGYGSLWFGESLGREAFTQAAILLAETQSLHIGTGIATINGRDPWSTANAARTLDERYSPRFILGLGVSHAALVARRGHNYTAPVPTMRAYLESMDSAPWARGPIPNPLKVLAALRPGMLSLARDRAHGAHPYFVPVEHTRRAREILGPNRILVPVVSAVFSASRAEARKLSHRHMQRFLRMANYAANLESLGWTQRDIDGSGSDALFDALIAWGDSAQIRSRVDEHIAAGADHVLVEVIAATFSELMDSLDALDLRQEWAAEPG